MGRAQNQGRSFYHSEKEMLPVLTTGGEYLSPCFLNSLNEFILQKQRGSYKRVLTASTAALGLA